MPISRIDWLDSQATKKDYFCEAAGLFYVQPMKISYINKLTKDNISISIKATQYEPN